MPNPFEQIDKIYCINLKDRPDRKQQAKEEFFRMEVHNVEFVEGIIFTGYKDKKRNACVGNHLAHAECLKRAQEDKAETCLIFEDDVEFFKSKEDTHEILGQALQYLPKPDWRMLYLGINMDRYSAERYAKNLARLNGGLSTHAYIVNHYLYSKLIEVNSNTEMFHNDVFYAENIHPFYLSFVTNPLLCGQRESFSDIMGTIMNSSEMMKQRFIEHLR
jgi:GR25 family glycosyltransferase involved in LPS biosynthesis